MQRKEYVGAEWYRDKNGTLRKTKGTKVSSPDESMIGERILDVIRMAAAVVVVILIAVIMKGWC